MFSEGCFAQFVFVGACIHKLFRYKFNTCGRGSCHPYLEMYALCWYTCQELRLAGALHLYVLRLNVKDGILSLRGHILKLKVGCAASVIFKLFSSVMWTAMEDSSIISAILMQICNVYLPPI